MAAARLARDNMSLLIGEAAPARFEDAVRDEIAGHPGVDEIVDLRTMMLGPDRVLVAAAVDFAPSSSDAVEALADQVQVDVSRRFPEVQHVFLDPTPGT